MVSRSTSPAFLSHSFSSGRVRFQSNMVVVEVTVPVVVVPVVLVPVVLVPVVLVAVVVVRVKVVVVLVTDVVVVEIGIDPGELVRSVSLL